jgi:hypothetical protein
MSLNDCIALTNKTLSFLSSLKKLAPSLVHFLILLNLFSISACGSGSSENDVVAEPPVIVSAKLTQFSFLKLNNPNLDTDEHLNISGNMITGRISTNTSVKDLIATFVHNGSEVSVSELVQNSNSSVNNFSNIVTYTVKASNGTQSEFQIDLTKFTGLPIIYIATDGGVPIESKDDYVEGTVSLDGGRYNDNLSQVIMKIRGRGNSTWGNPKKPFQMKLDDKMEFLDMPTDKKWLFLAEYSDKTMLRNTIAFEMGHISRLDWTPESSFAEVYLNEEYNGTYNITQKVEESDNRVVLGDTGYLLEIDQLSRLDADDVYFTTGDFLINIKEPNLEFDSVEYDFVKNLVNNFESVLHSSQFNDPVTGYVRFIDIDSFIDWYLISEITKNVDSKSFSSIFLNVLPGEKIKMGPLWDFDLSFGNVDYADSQYSVGYWVKDHPWYARLFQDPEFVIKIRERFSYFRNNQNYILNKIDEHANNLKWAQQENDNKWQTIGIYVWPNSVVLNSYDEEVEHLKNWYVERMNWLDGAFAEL